MTTTTALRAQPISRASSATKSCTNFAVTSSGTLLYTALKPTFGSAVFPKSSIDFLIQGIENNNLSLSHSYGPVFAAKRTPPRVNTPQAGGGGGGGGGRGATPAA
jgi:hypothetical protein